MPELRDGLITLAPLTVNDIDGIKLTFTDGWCLVRPSGTEPLIRLTAEAKTEAAVHRIYDEALEIIKEEIQKANL
jgi:phosphoglucosamine mutase